MKKMVKKIIVGVMAVMLLGGMLYHAGDSGNMNATVYAKEKTAAQVLKGIKKKMKDSYTCDKKYKAADAISYYDLDKKKIKSVVYEGTNDSSMRMDVVIVLKVKKGYATTAKKKLQKALDQTVSYAKMYDMDLYRTQQARIYVKGNYVGMFILGKFDSKASVQKQARTAKKEAKKIDKAWKAMVGGKGKNLAKIN